MRSAGGSKCSNAGGSSACRSNGAAVSLLVLMVLGGLVLFIGKVSSHYSGLTRARHHAAAKQHIQRQFGELILSRTLRLESRKADAVYRMLAPSDVKVIVGGHTGGVMVRGTAREVEALQRFEELLARLEERDPRFVDDYIEAVLRCSLSSRRHELSSEKATLLFNALNFEDVPVLPRLYHDGVLVQANEADQATIADVAEILRGRRLR